MLLFKVILWKWTYIPHAYILKINLEGHNFKCNLYEHINFIFYSLCYKQKRCTGIDAWDICLGPSNVGPYIYLGVGVGVEQCVKMLPIMDVP